MRRAESSQRRIFWGFRSFPVSVILGHHRATTRKPRIVEAIADRLMPGGLVYLGREETAQGLTDRLVAVPGSYDVYASAPDVDRSSGEAERPALGLAS